MGLLGATGVGVGAIVGGGILALAGVAFGTTGPSTLLAFLLNGLELCRDVGGISGIGRHLYFFKKNSVCAGGLYGGLGSLVRLHYRECSLCLRVCFLRWDRRRQGAVLCSVSSGRFKGMISRDSLLRTGFGGSV
jgi:hypothetical protein